MTTATSASNKINVMGEHCVDPLKIGTGVLDQRSDFNKQLSCADEQDENDDELPVPTTLDDPSIVNNKAGLIPQS